jgi:hypothetical protein
MTIYACHIPLGKLYQYDMNVVHNMHTFGIKKNIQYWYEETIVGSKYKNKLFLSRFMEKGEAREKVESLNNGQEFSVEQKLMINSSSIKITSVLRIDFWSNLSKSITR